METTVRYGSSPHTRGARGRVHRDRRPVRIIPAYAGSTVCPISPFPLLTDHPRIRGEHPDRSGSSRPAPGSSPHTRGAPPPFRFSLNVEGDHPRIRGEHGEPLGALAPQDGSSPHTRGARLRVPEGLFGHRIIPAYAGSTPLTDLKSGGGGDHPRIRGEHERPRGFQPRSAGSSPHTRGARNAPASDSAKGRIIPAYAGST